MYTLEQIARNIKPEMDILAGADLNGHVGSRGETGVASNKNTEATVSETEIRKGKMSSDSLKHITWE